MFSGFASLLDLLEALHGHLPGQLEVRAGRRPEPEHELPRVDLREQLGADLHPQHPEDQAARRRDRPARPASAGGRTSPRPCGRPLRTRANSPCVLVVVPHVLEQRHAHDRHERAGEQVRRDHREADAQGQRHEQRPERVGHDERRDEHRQDAEQRQQPRHRRDAGCRGAPPRRCCRVRCICTWTFSTVTVDSSTRMPIASAMPPSDMMLIVLPVSQSPNSEPSRASGMLSTTTITLLQVAEEQQDHQAGQARADQALGRHALDRRHARSATRRTRS